MKIEMALSSRIRGGLYGLLVGDALGVPYEFHAASEIPPRASIEMTPPHGFRRAHSTVPPGTWSDDGALALCLLEALLDVGSLDQTKLAQAFLRWAQVGHLAVDQVVFDIGIQTRRALANISAGMPLSSCGLRGVGNNGNGSLMRVLPLALWHQGSNQELVEFAVAQSELTHAHAISKTCCALYVLVARALLKGSPMADAWHWAEQELGTLVLPFTDATEVLRDVVAERRKPPLGSGYVVDSLWSSRHILLSEKDYEGVVKAAIELGDDTDTTACIAGGLAGIHYGYGGIPERWLKSLRGQELLHPLETRLIESIR